MSREQLRTLFNPDKRYVVSESEKLPTLDGSNLLNVKPISETVEFTSTDSSNCTWSECVATITHSLNCIPIVTVLQADGEIVFPTVRVLSASAISLDFGDVMPSGTMRCVVGYGAEYGNATEISNQLTSYVQQAASAASSAENAKAVAQTAAATAVANSIQLDFSINADEELIMTRLGGTAFDFDVSADGELLFQITM